MKISNRGTLVFLFLISTLCCIAQSGNIQINKDCLVFKTDTFNQLDRYGRLLGKGLAVIQEKTSEGHLFSTAVGKGVFLSGLKEGTWFYSSTKNLGQPDAEVHYFNDRIYKILFYKQNSSELWLKAEPGEQDWKYFAWDQESKKYTETNQDIQSLLALYNIQ